MADVAAPVTRLDILVLCRFVLRAYASGITSIQSKLLLVGIFGCYVAANVTATSVKRMSEGLYILILKPPPLVKAASEMKMYE